MKLTATYEARRHNLRALIARLNAEDPRGRGGIAHIARVLQFTWPGFVSQMAHERRVMTETTARRIERSFNLLPYQMDEATNGRERPLI